MDKEDKGPADAGLLSVAVIQSIKRGFRGSAMKKRIILITGLMASGKSTVAQLLSERMEKAVHLRGDVFRRMIVSGREEMRENATQEAIDHLYLRYRLTADAAKTYADHGFMVILQDNYYGQALLDITEMLEGYLLDVIVLCPDAATIGKREIGRGKSGYTCFAVEPLYTSFMAETPRIGHWIDSSELTAEATVEAILSVLDGKNGE